LFFNAKLSHDGWMSCHSCHTDGHTNGLLNDNFSDTSFGAPKRVLTLLGKANTAPFAWNGKAADLQTQIKNSLSLTMQMDEPPSDDQLQELAAFLKTLPPPPSIDEARQQVDKKAIARGQKVFNQADCRQCHAPPAFTVTGLFDVGLSDSEGNQEFNPPSLLGVGQRVHFFHNNTAKTLSDVFLKHKHPVGPQAQDAELLTPQQVADLVQFLRSL
jgi:cytochrome c peroxidase